MHLTSEEEILLIASYRKYLESLARELTGIPAVPQNRKRETARAFMKALEEAQKNSMFLDGFGHFDQRYLRLLLNSRCNEIGIQVCDTFGLTHETLRSIKQQNTPRKFK